MKSTAYQLLATDGEARRGQLHTPHGTVETPAFMPVGTQATVKGLLPSQVETTGAEILLANTYHLLLRPGHELIRDLGGLHAFMGWDHPILTDSGGYQVFSLAHRRKITEEGVIFRSHLDGSKVMLGPAEAMRIQLALGSDILMSFDECIPYPVSRETAEESLARTHRWEEATLEFRPEDGRALFAIVQGGIFEDLRLQSAEFLTNLPFDGYAVGGLFVGEERCDTLRVLGAVGPRLPADQARYVMGVGTPLEVVECVMRGFDMFDCVLPTRNARHGQAMTFAGAIRLKAARFQRDEAPIEEDCDCLACLRFSRAYLRHLLMAKEILAATLISHHNLRFMQRLMDGVRRAIEEKRLVAFSNRLASGLGAS
ncbi:MAG TPA: tRNA guanosine(34) transglycosylase Tgt [Planctomycetes bacterium]|nr:tRNA guanosine(34) transglycosylase Tgt [Planctomycetota bacterium]